MTTRILLLALACLGLHACAHTQGSRPKLDSALLAQRLDLMVKDDTLRAQLAVTKEHVAIYATAADKLAGKPEHLVRIKDIPTFVTQAKAQSQTAPVQRVEKWPNTRPEFPQPLKGYRIALDPGHVGGTMEMGELEWKYVRIQANPAKGIPEEIAFNEGNLALGTALILDSMFQAAGAEVMLTRRGEGMTAFGYDFDTWLDTMQVRDERLRGRTHMTLDSFPKREEWHQYRHACAGRWYVTQTDAARRDSLYWCTKAGRTATYKGPFLRAEFLERARKVNAFQPDLTLIIHYNVHEANEPGKGGNRDAVEDNKCMAFVPGAFMAGELGTPEDRLDFMIHWLSDDMQPSLELSDEILAAHVSQLGVPRLVGDTTLGYIVRASQYTVAPGVYARNLALTRMMHGVMCFGESLYQDNRLECVRLNEHRLALPGMTTLQPTRIREVARAYFDGVMNYAVQRQE